MSLFNDLFGGGDPALGQYADANRALYQNITPPDEKWTTYAPEAYSPTMGNATQVQDNPLVRSAQMSALNNMGQLAQNGLSAVDQQGYQNARDIGNQMARSGNLAAMQDAQARGVGGSGMEFAQREMANQAGAQRAQQAGLQQAADSARQRALYNQAYSNALGNQRGQDLNLNAQNAGILNQFNMANTNALNSANQYNVGNQNQAQLVNQQGRTGLQQQNFQNQMAQAGGIAGANQMGANAEAANNAANNAALNSMWGLGMGAAGLGVEANRPAPQYNYNFQS